MSATAPSRSRDLHAPADRPQRDDVGPRVVVAREPAAPQVSPSASSIAPADAKLTWFNALYESTYHPVWAYVFRMAGDRSVADDVVQEAFVRVLQTPRAVRERGPLEPYLYRVASNLLRDHWRRRGRDARLHRALSLRAGARERPRSGGALERSHELEATFHALKPRERALLWLAHVDGYSHREIATILSLRPLSVRVLLARARKRLASLLDG